MNSQRQSIFCFVLNFCKVQRRLLLCLFTKWVVQITLKLCYVDAEKCMEKNKYLREPWSLVYRYEASNFLCDKCLGCPFVLFVRLLFFKLWPTPVNLLPHCWVVIWAHVTYPTWNKSINVVEKALTGKRLMLLCDRSWIAFNLSPWPSFDVVALGILG